ncbi:hypothetical protein AAG570_001482 [Ranatra chinensis]|uniref:Uncharacterized protein n=1 Tax=Ranatra chinensis TaxID=642074 RepID=A0ABD0YAL9_9HEMI
MFAYLPSSAVVLRSRFTPQVNLLYDQRDRAGQYRKAGSVDLGHSATELRTSRPRLRNDVHSGGCFGGKKVVAQIEIGPPEYQSDPYRGGEPIVAVCGSAVWAAEDFQRMATSVLQWGPQQPHLQGRPVDKRHYKKDSRFVLDLYTLTYDSHESLDSLGDINAVRSYSIPIYQ